MSFCDTAKHENDPDPLPASGERVASAYQNGRAG